MCAGGELICPHCGRDVNKPGLAEGEQRIANILRIGENQKGQIIILRELLKKYDLNHEATAYDCIEWYDKNKRKLTLPASAYKNWLMKTGDRFIRKVWKDSVSDWGSV